MGTTAAQKKLFFNLRRIKGQIEAIDDGDLHPDHVTEIATKLGVPEHEVVNMNRRMGGQDSSLNAPLKSDSETDWQDMLVDDDIDQESQLAEQSEMDLRRELLLEAMQGLNEREQHILTERRLKDDVSTLEDLSQIYDISRERVRQIEARAFEKLQKAMKNAMRERMLASEVAREEHVS
jgi:RNA polymerase sigma-32 factor